MIEFLLLISKIFMTVSFILFASQLVAVQLGNRLRKRSSPTSVSPYLKSWRDRLRGTDDA